MAKFVPSKKTVTETLKKKIAEKYGNDGRAKPIELRRVRKVGMKWNHSTKQEEPQFARIAAWEWPRINWPQWDCDDITD